MEDKKYVSTIDEALAKPETTIIVSRERNREIRPNITLYTRSRTKDDEIGHLTCTVGKNRHNDVAFLLKDFIDRYIEAKALDPELKIELFVYDYYYEILGQEEEVPTRRKKDTRMLALENK